MNAVFELPKASQRFCLAYIRGQIVTKNSASVAEAISILIGSCQGNSNQNQNL